jgi:hypothetical protein
VLASKVPYRETIDVTSCTSDASCALNESCVRGFCYRVGRRCNDARDATVYWGTPYSCGKYACEPISGDCRRDCIDSNSCSGSNHCALLSSGYGVCQ